MGDDLQDISDALIANSSVKWGMGGGAATSIFGSLSNNDLLVITGILTTDEAANNRVELAKLQAELKCCCEKQELREQIVLGKVNELALTTQSKFGCLDGTIANIMGTIGQITSTIVPISAVCPTPMAKYNSWTAPTNTPAAGA